MFGKNLSKNLKSNFGKKMLILLILIKIKIIAAFYVPKNSQKFQILDGYLFFGLLGNINNYVTQISTIFDSPLISFYSEK